MERIKEKVPRPNRIVKLPRQLFTLLGEIAYFQEKPISTQDFIIEILEEIGRAYGERMQKEAMNARPLIVKSYLKRSGVLNNPDDNNKFGENTRFFDGINI